MPYIGSAPPGVKGRADCFCTVPLLCCCVGRYEEVSRKRGFACCLPGIFPGFGWCLIVKFIVQDKVNLQVPSSKFLFPCLHKKLRSWQVDKKCRQVETKYKMMWILAKPATWSSPKGCVFFNPGDEAVRFSEKSPKCSTSYKMSSIFWIFLSAAPFLIKYF